MQVAGVAAGAGIQDERAVAVTIARNVGLEIIRSSGRSVIDGDHEHAIKLIEQLAGDKDACYMLVANGGFPTACVMTERKVCPHDSKADHIIRRYAKKFDIMGRLVAETGGVNKDSWWAKICVLHSALAADMRPLPLGCPWPLCSARV